MKKFSLEQPFYQAYCQQSKHIASPECTKTKDDKRSLIKHAIKPTPAFHLTNLTASFPQISDDAQKLADRSKIHYARSFSTMNMLVYGSPWAIMSGYDPRSAILNSRSTIAAANHVYRGKDYLI